MTKRALTGRTLRSSPITLLALIVCVVTSLAGLPAHGQNLYDFGAVNDAYLGDALYHYYQKDFFQALSRSLVAEKTDRITTDSAQAQKLLAELYMAYGVYPKTEAILKNIPKTKERGQSIENQLWLDLAKAQYGRGLYAEAERALNSVGGKLDDDAEDERIALQGLLFMAKGDFNKAAETFRQLRGKSDWGIYGRFNLGIALLNARKFDDGVDELDRVGKENYRSDELRALKDRANLALGFLFLRAKEPEKAIAYLERVRLNGTYANKALLGIGWSYMMRANYEKALVPLVELQGRSLADSAVMEGYLATPFAFSQAQADKQAADYYEKAISIYQGELKSLDELSQQINKKNLLSKLLKGDPHHEKQWLERIDGWPHSTASRVFTHLVADQWFHASLNNYQDLKLLQEQLKNWETIVEVYQKMLNTQRDNLHGRGNRSATRPSANVPQSVVDLMNSRSSTFQTLKEKSQQNVAENLVKVEEIQQRANSLKPEVKQAIAEHELYLKKLVMSEVEQETQRITQYLNQARYALAQIYERAINQGNQ